MGTDRMGYRPELDGLRALAVIAVMLHHTFVDAAPSGHLGVDLFFVLSGFLITRLALEEHARTGSLDLRAFWRRRAYRLLPALLLALPIVLLWGWVIGGQVREQTITGSWTSLLYVTNWARATGAIDTAGLMTHAWSLAIEEQFYLLWPLLLVWLLRRGGPRTVLAVSIAGAAVSWMLRAYGATAGWDLWSRVYTGTDTRADALLFGCALAAATMLTVRHVPRVVGWLSWTAVVAIVLTVPKLWMFLWGQGAFALAVVGVIGATLARPPRWLAWGPLVDTGRVSYGLYLWHVPVVKIFRHVDPSRAAWSMTLALAISVGLAVLSWRLVEQPALRRKRRDADHQVVPDRHNPDRVDVAELA